MLNSLHRRFFHSVCKCPRIQKRLQQTKPEVSQTRQNYDGPGKTTVSFLNEEADAGLLIDAYSQHGFRLNNGVFVVGPIALFPKSVLAWNVGGAKDINIKSLELFCRLDPKIDILVLGMGDDAIIDVRLIKELKRSGINVEALPTNRACSTFNFLNAEYRYVAAALIPPQTVRTAAEDLFEEAHQSKFTMSEVLNRSERLDAGMEDPLVTRKIRGDPEEKK